MSHSTRHDGICNGNYCTGGTEVVFNLVLKGEVPVNWLGYRVLGICKNPTHTASCLSCYHYKTFYISGAAIRHFLSRHDKALCQRDHHVKAIETLAIQVRKHRGTVWAEACGYYIRQSRMLHSFFIKDLKRASVAQFQQLALSGHLSRHDVPTLPLPCLTEADTNARSDVYEYIAFLHKTRSPVRQRMGPIMHSVYTTMVLCMRQYDVPAELVLMIWGYIR